MQHRLDATTLGPRGQPMIAAIEACVHCGFCLPACPTYRDLGTEADSPRGRIVLMKEVLEGTLSPGAAQPHLDRCLGCLGCEPACPSGVPYRDLISPYRALTAAGAERTVTARLRRWLAKLTVPHPARFRLALRAAQWTRGLHDWLPTALRPLVALTPRRLPPAQVLPTVVPAQGSRRARVALLAGCAQQVLDPDINAATIEVLTRNGVEVLIPPTQGCCGGLAWHTGDLPAAQAQARHNLAAFPTDVDAILTNAAGCGSALHEYPLILAGTPEEARARELAARAVDIAVFLDRLGLRERPAGFTATPRTIVMQDACHLANAQGVHREPRALLETIPGVTLVEPADSQLCCGSAGTYNIDQPEIAARLGEQKARALMATGADLIASGNIGCQTQIRHHLQRLGSPIAIRHPVQILRDAYAPQTKNDRSG